MKLTQGQLLVPARPHRRADHRADRNTASTTAGRSASSTPTIRIPRNTYWEMWGHADVRPEGRRRRDDGDQRVPQGLRRPLHPRHRLRLQPWLGVGAACRSSSTGRRTSRASAWCGRRSAAGDPLHHRAPSRPRTRRPSHSSPRGALPAPSPRRTTASPLPARRSSALRGADARRPACDDR